jgi:hypothetical protein
MAMRRRPRRGRVDTGSGPWGTCREILGREVMVDILIPSSKILAPKLFTTFLEAGKLVRMESDLRNSIAGE